MNLSEAYQSVYSSQEVDEAVKGQDSEMRKTAAAERAAERKSGSKAQSPGREGPSAGKSYADYQKISIEKHDKATKKNKDVAGLVAKEEVENVEELYKGKHGQSEKEYMDSRSDAGKQISGDSKHSGAAYSHRSFKGQGKPAKPGERQKLQGKMTKADRDELAIRKAGLKKEELDIFDTVIEYLQVEGIVESFEDAQWMMANVIDEEDIDSILDEARRSDKEGYARGSKENPKRKDIPHGDVSQRSMLHSKLKRRANEMGRERRSSARNKAGGRTPVGKKEKAFLQAVTRTAGQVAQPNVPDTGKHKK